MLDETPESKKRYWLLSVTVGAFEKHPDRNAILGPPGTPYFWGDSDSSTQMVGRVKTGDTERIYWATPETELGQVISDLNKYTKEKVRAQVSIPRDFTSPMERHVEALRNDHEYKSDVTKHTVLIGSRI